LRTLLVVAFMVVPLAGADAAFLDGNRLRDCCSSTDEGNQGACLGYVVGVADTLSAGGGTGRRVCILNIEAAQAVSTTKKY
jgi:hypothetical protein